MKARRTTNPRRNLTTASMDSIFRKKCARLAPELNTLAFNWFSKSSQGRRYDNLLGQLIKHAHKKFFFFSFWSRCCLLFFIEKCCQGFWRSFASWWWFKISTLSPSLQHAKVLIKHCCALLCSNSASCAFDWVDEALQSWDSNPGPSDLTQRLIDVSENWATQLMMKQMK